jgi:hypothetical protein
MSLEARAVAFIALLLAPAAESVAVPVIGIEDRAALEGNLGAQAAVFHVTLSAAATTSLTVSYTTVSVSATVGDNDYVASAGTVTFAPGQTSRPIQVTLNGDTALEKNETFLVQLSNPMGGDGATIADATGSGSILDDDMTTLVCPNGFVTDGEVFAIDEVGGTIYVGGRFGYAGPVTGHGVPVDATTGEALDGFPVVDGAVQTVVPDGTGGWFIGGGFTRVGGVPRAGLARILSDNTVAAWDPNHNGFLHTLHVSGGIVYVGGSFTAIGGAARNHIASFDIATGQLTSWNPGANSSVYCIVASSGTVFVGGFFTAIGGQPRNRIAALDAVTGAATNWNPNASSSVECLAVSGSTVYVGGAFTTIGGAGRNRIAALDAASGVATTWNPNANSTVESIVLSGATVYAGGGFTTIGMQMRRGIAAIDAANGLPTAWNPGVSGTVQALFLDGSTVYAAGQFTQMGQRQRRYVAAVDAISGIATSWDPNASATAWAIARSGAVVYVGGQMTSLGGETRNHLAAFDAASGALEPWDPDVGNTNASIATLVATANTVYVGGNFSEIGGSLGRNLAALDATTGQALWSSFPSNVVYALTLSGNTLYVGGEFINIGPGSVPRNYIAALDATSGNVTPWNPNAGGSSFPNVNAILVDGSTVYVGGDFGTIGGQARTCIAALSATTGLATAWDPQATGEVFALAASGGTIYAGGSFAVIGGQDRFSIAALDATSGSATPWDPSVTWDVRALLIENGVVYAGGEFSSAGGQQRRCIAALDIQTGLALPWNPDPFSGVAVNALAMIDGSLYVGGNFDAMASQPATGIACLGPADIATDVAESRSGADLGLKVLSSPRHGAVEIAYELSTAGRVRIGIFDVRGRRIALAVDEAQRPGSHRVLWDGSRRGSALAAGVYFVQLDTNGRTANGRFVRLRQ